MGLLQKILFLIVVLGVFQQVTPQTTSDTITVTVSSSISNTVSTSISNSVSPSISNTVSPSNSNSNSYSPSNSNSNSYSPSNSNSYSPSISNTVSTSISGSTSNSYSTSLSYSLTVTFQFGLPQVTGVANACPTDPTRICVYFNAPNPSYPSYNIYLTRNGTSLKFTTSTVPTSSNPFVISAVNLPGFTPGSTYFVQVTGVNGNGVEGPLSVPLVVSSDFPSIDTAPFDLTRIHNVRCGLVGNVYQCRWENGNSFAYTNTTLVVRCSGNRPNSNGFQLASFGSTTVASDTFLAVVAPYGSTCTSKLKSKYTDGGKTKFVKRQISTPLFV